MHKMNKITGILLCVAIAMTATAQKIDRSKPPKPGPAPVIKFADPAIFTLPNGLTVLVVENHKLPRVSAKFNIDMGPVLEGKKAGVMELMGAMLAEGTKTMPKAKFDEAIDLLGADLNLYSSGGSVSALTRYFNQAFLLMADAIKQPSFPQESFDKLKTQAITGLKASEKSAAAISARVVDALSYGKQTALGEFETEQSIKDLTLEDIKQAYKNYITPSRSYLTFVGDITPAKAKELAVQAYAKWSGKKLSLPEIKNVDNVPNTEINLIDLPTAVQGEISVTNLINNPLSNPDYHALVLANQILGGGPESKLFMNLREKHGFTYGSGSNTGSGRFQTQFKGRAQVRSEKVDSAISEMLIEIENMRNGKITEEELAVAKAKYNGSFALGMEDPNTTATYASNILINKLPKDFYRTFLQKINSVTIADIERVSKKYFNRDNSRIVIVGNSEKILPNLTRLGYPIKKYDRYAEPVVEKPKETAVKESEKNADLVSAYSLIENYLKAIGGKDQVAKLNSLKTTFTMEVMGNTVEGVDLKMAPAKHSAEMKMGEMKVFQSMFDGTKGYVGQMGQKKDMDEKQIKEALDDRGIIPQLYYNSKDFTTNYLGTGKVGEEEAYKIKITKPSGKVSIEYYSAKTGLLLKEESVSTEGGADVPAITEFADYQKVNDILFPFTITQTLGEQEFVMKIKEIKVNEGVSDADFK